LKNKTLFASWAQKHIDVADDNEVEEIMIELEDLEQPTVPKVISIVEVRNMVTQLTLFTKAHSLFSKELNLLISIVEVRNMVTQLTLFTKAHSLFSKELNLLSLNATLKDLYNFTLKQSKIHQYFQ